MLISIVLQLFRFAYIETAYFLVFSTGCIGFIIHFVDILCTLTVGILYLCCKYGDVVLQGSMKGYPSSCKQRYTNYILAQVLLQKPEIYIYRSYMLFLLHIFYNIVHIV